MKQALISPNEPSYNGQRVAQIVQTNETFPIAEPLFWMECNDEVVADLWYYDPTDQTIKIIPEMA